ncbi:MAG: AAA family ATPase [Thermoleophilaceae bacterium]|nr:AAA family ATPase [Thermoleophilaceae bacterium]
MASARRSLEPPASDRGRTPTLASEWRALTRAATVVAVLTSPAFFALLYTRSDWPLWAALLGAVVAAAAFRGLVEVIARRLIPSPSLYGADEEARREDVVARRRAWYWRTKFRRLGAAATVFVLVVGTVAIVGGHSFGEAIGKTADGFVAILPALLGLGVQLPLFFFFNLVILFGPLLFFGLRQIKAYEPGDADWGVRLEDVRGQAEAKEEVRRVIALWQSGEAFEKAGGKRERGLLFLGAPGTGKTMLSKAIATGFNCPFVTIPGSGFAQTFIGLDVIIVLFLVRRAKRLARKWGGQCIVFIDEIDAVGMRRAALGGGAFATTSHSLAAPDLLFFGPQGALTPTGDLVLETPAWRERLFARRAGERPDPLPPLYRKLDATVRQVFPGGLFGGMGSLALNQLLVQMDGIDDPPATRRFLVKRINTFLDALYVVPQRIGSVPLRLRPPRPREEQVYFIGATNAPIDALDPALTRPGRMGRHIWFRTPTKNDRKDIFDLYLAKVAHEPDLDTDRRREELARITNGYSPAMIEQVCSMALTHAHADGRASFGWHDIVEAMTTVETGTAINVEYVPEETRAVAIHEAGHAVCGHLYMKDTLSTRLSIRMRSSGSLGHHQAMQVEERFSSWRHEEVATLIWTLGAMAAERVFYGENSQGVGGDVFSATALACAMVGSWGMGPARPDLRGRVPLKALPEREAEVMDRFKEIGTQIMRRAGSGSALQHDPLAAVLGDPDKRTAVAQLLGQAYLAAHHTVLLNREGVERVAETLVEQRELYGDEVVDLLEQQQLRQPDIDLLSEESWPRI